MFADHKHLLQGALSALQASKDVLTSIPQTQEHVRRLSEF